MVKKSRPPAVSDPHAADYLLFVDTNIWLDLYRLPTGDDLTKALETIARAHDRMISTSQVWMEFLKHRQAEISKTLAAFKTEKDHDPHLPPIIADEEAVKALRRLRHDLKEQRRRIAVKVEQIMLEPEHHDPVYQSLRSIFAKPTDLILGRENDRRHQIRRLARKRWHLGYPPRKERDTAIGDAVNWEWIVDCAMRKSGHVIIVSRDGDYGHAHDKEFYLNDWLKEEFVSRLAGRGSVLLFNRLAAALERMAVPVPPEVAKAEHRLFTAHAHLSGRAEAAFSAGVALS